jgi:hypothetical protein
MSRRSVLLLLVAVATLAGCAATPETVAPASGAAGASAPVLQSPPDTAQFVESDVTLTWRWDAGLAEGQFYVVRIRAGDDGPVEIWTEEASLNAQDAIDGLLRATGDFTWQVAVVNTGMGLYESMGSDWSEPRTLHRVRHINPTPLPANQQTDLTRMIASQAGDATAQIDAVRAFIDQNSDDSAQDLFAADYRDAIAAMWAYHRGEGDAPRLYCDGAATAMLTVLAELGIDSRLIFLYGQAEGWINQHTFLEVFNPDTQAWEVHDPVWDITFIDTDTGGRASVERLVFGSLATVEACKSDGTCVPASEAPEAGYLGAFRRGYTERTVWVNPDRFDVSQRYAAFGDANLPEFIAGDDPGAWSFRFESWDRP